MVGGVPELDVLKPLHPSKERDEDAWPEFRLTDVVVTDKRSQHKSVFVTDEEPLTLVGELRQKKSEFKYCTSFILVTSPLRRALLTGAHRSVSRQESRCDEDRDPSHNTIRHIGKRRRRYHMGSRQSRLVYY
jgi:hypothetical protein